MLGMGTLTLSSPTTMVAQTTLTSSKKLILSNRTHSLPMSLLSPTNQNFKKHKPFITAVSSVQSDNVGSSDAPATKSEFTKYYFIVANAKFMLDDEEHFQEQLFERQRYYGERNKEQDYWLVIEPKFLDSFPDFTKKLRRPAVALVSTNGPWITFMKLRLDRVLSGSFEADSLEEALASNPTKLEFEKPAKWVAPYPKYESGWWETFLPSGQKEVNS